MTKIEIPKGKGLFIGDDEYDPRLLLNKIVDKGYLPIIKPGKIYARGFGARISDKLFVEEVYKDRSICEGFFSALTN